MTTRTDLFSRAIKTLPERNSIVFVRLYSREIRFQHLFSYEKANSVFTYIYIYFYFFNLLFTLPTGNRCFKKYRFNYGDSIFFIRNGGFG